MCLLHEKPRDKLSRKTFSILADWAQNKATLPTTKFEACIPCKNNTKKNFNYKTRNDSKVKLHWMFSHSCITNSKADLDWYWAFTDRMDPLH